MMEKTDERTSRVTRRAVFIDDADIQKVRDATDIVEVIGQRTPVKQKGRDFWCCCPLHDEKTPSFKIDPATQLWHCFGCGEGGDVFGFLMKTEDMTFPEAVRALAERAHIDLPERGGKPGVPTSEKQRLKEACYAAEEFFHAQLMRNPAAGAQRARDYLSERGFGGTVPKDWNLGFAPGRGSLLRHLSAKGIEPKIAVAANLAMVSRDGRMRDRFYDRVMFPIRDVQGECIAFGGRVIGDGEPKYLNSQETPIFHKSEVLYGLDRAKAAMASTGIAIVVEGYTDVIALHEGGVRNAVATLGTALTRKHIRILSRHAKRGIVYLFDGDAAGQRAADRALQFIDSAMTPEAGRSRIELSAVTLPDDLDPAEFIAARGAEALQELIGKAKPLLLYGIERRLAGHDLHSAEGRTAALNDALSVLAPIKDSLLAKDYAVQVAGRVHVREDDALEALRALQPPRTAPEPAEEGARPTATNRRGIPAPERNRLRIERELLSLAAQDPAMALQHADVLAQTHWHEPTHGLIAEALLAVLTEAPDASPAEIIARVEAVCTGSTRILTAGVHHGEATNEQIGRYLTEELAIGDAEDAIAEMKMDLSHADGLTPEESDGLFQAIVMLQKDLAARRAAHKRLS